MMRKRAAYVCMIGMIMTIGLTACQESNSAVMEPDGQISENVTGQDGQITTITEQTDKQVMESSEETADITVSPAQFPFTDNPEFQACAEWQTFLDSYDTDGAILAQASNDSIAGYQYEHYFCYSEDMEHKIDEICEKNGLSLLSGFQVADSYSDLLAKSGVGEFCADSESARHHILCGYRFFSDSLRAIRS